MESTVISHRIVLEDEFDALYAKPRTHDPFMTELPGGSPPSQFRLFVHELWTDVFSPFRSIEVDAAIEQKEEEYQKYPGMQGRNPSQKYQLHPG